MELIQIFIPLYDQAGNQFEESLFTELKNKLTGRFQGVTIYHRSPATGLWKEGGKTTRDQIVIYEVIAPELDLEFWRPYKADLEKQFAQQQIMIRSSEIKIIT